MKLTDEIVQKVRCSLESGCDAETACSSVGATSIESSRWIHDGHVAAEAETKLTAYATRCLAIVNAASQSKAAMEVKFLDVIQRASEQGSWPAAAWWLERAVPEKYGKQGDGKVGGARKGAGRKPGSVSAPDRVMRGD